MAQLSLAVDETADLDELLQHIDQLDDDPRAWPKILTDIMAVAISQIQRSHPDLACRAPELARDMTVAISHYLGGRQLYLPRDERLQRALRDNAIYRQFNGRNHQQLADATGLTVMQIYNIIAQQKKLHLARVQPALPGL